MSSPRMIFYRTYKNEEQGKEKEDKSAHRNSQHKMASDAKKKHDFNSKLKRKSEASS